MTYTLLNDITFSGGPIAAAAAPGSITGFTDVIGNKYSLDSSSILRGSNVGGGTGNPLMMASGVACTTKVRKRFVAGSDTASTLWVMVRAKFASGASTGYLCGFSGTGQMQLGTILAGTISTPNALTVTALTAGTTYWAELEAVQTNSTTTTISSRVFASNGTTQIGSTLTATDTAAALQNVLGTAGLFYFNHGVSSTSPGVTEVQLYSGDPAATALSLSGPSTATTGVASTAFTCAANGVPGGSVTITPTDGAGGSFAPATLTFTPTIVSGTFTYTPTASGTTVNVGVTNTGSLTNPSTVAVTIPASTLLQVSSASFSSSPGNWRGDTGRGGSAWRQAWANGAWFRFKWLGSSSPTALLNLTSTSSGQLINYQINNYFYYQVPANAPISLPNLVASGANSLTAWLDSSPQIARWSPESNVTRVNGLIIDAASSAGVASAARPWIIVHGNSISEGIGAETQSNNHSFVMAIQRTMDALGIDVCQDGCGYSGYLSPGDSSSDVPALYVVSGGVYSQATSRWDKISAGISRLDSSNHLSAYGGTGQEPAAIFVIMSVNEDLHGYSLTDTRLAVSGYIAAARAAAPNAVISICLDFGHEWTGGSNYRQTYPVAILGGVADYKAANPSDKRVVSHSAGVALATMIESAPNIAGDTVHLLRAGQLLGSSIAMGWVLADLKLSTIARQIGLVKTIHDLTPFS